MAGGTGGRYELRLIEGGGDLRPILDLRRRAFGAAFGPAAAAVAGRRDAQDPRCRHLVVAAADGTPVACCRLRLYPDIAAADRGYTGGYYDLRPLFHLDAPAMELGRLCERPGWRDPDILRLLWAGIARLIGDGGVRLVIGCTSLAGTEPDAHAAALARLRALHLGPRNLRPAARAAETVPLPALADPVAPAGSLPPLLRSYLALGGWVSDHAVIDRAMGTLHVFTALDVRSVPPGRARLLRVLAQRVRLSAESGRDGAVDGATGAD